MTAATAEMDRPSPAGSGPNGVHVVSDRAHELAAAGRFGEALALVDSALAAQANDAELVFARAATLFDWGRLRESLDGFLQAEALGLTRPALYLNLAWNCHLMRRADDAERYARKAVAADPQAGVAHVGLAASLQRRKRYEDAVAAYETALSLAPDSANCMAGIAYCKLELMDYAGCEQWLRKALRVAPDPKVLTTLGVALANLDRYDEAFAAFDEAEAMEAARGVSADTMLGRMFALMRRGEVREVVERLRPHLPACPDARLQSHYAFALLTLGQFVEGWEQYEVRWLQEPHLSHRPHYGKPAWSGQRLAGKAVLMRVEQGAGDVVQFARYATALKARGARVVLEVRPELTALARGFEDVDEVFAPPQPAPHFDYYVHIMSLPRVLATDVATIPAEVPYLRVHHDVWQRWAERVGDRGFRVGLAWAGNPRHPNDRYRSIALRELREIFDVAGVGFYSLQKQTRPGDLDVVPAYASLVDLGPELADFEATAAAIAQMDLVICVDTAVAHLAGAIGKPVWLMLPKFGDFRWFTEGDATPWYPTMRLFRQHQHGDWRDVVTRVRQALAEAVASGTVTVPPPPRATATALPPPPHGIARVAETRHGILQYIPERDDCARSVAYYGEFAEAQIGLLMHLLRAGARVIEAGAGIGAHTVPIARHIGISGHLMAYETDALLAQIAAQNLDANGVSPIVTMMRRPLAAAATRDATRDDSIDELQLARLDLLKIGTDADAAAILAGAAQTLWRSRPLLFVAARDAGHARAIGDTVRQYGYRTFAVRTPLFAQGNFNRREDDIFAGAAARAILGVPEEADAAIAFEGVSEIVPDGAALRASTNNNSEPASLLGKLKRWWR